MGIAHFLQVILPSSGRPLDLTTFVDSNSAAALELSQPSLNAPAAALAEAVDVNLLDSFGGRTKRLRVGVDVSTWIYRACMGFSDMLGDERHLTNQGRADLLMEQQTAHRRQRRGEEDGDVVEEEEEGEETSGQLSVPVQRYIAACTEQVKKRIVKLSRCVDVLVVLDGATPPVKAPTTEGRAEARQAFVRQRDDTTVDLTGQDTESRIKSFKRGGAGLYHNVVVANLINECRHMRIPFLVAPYEADGQLGYLNDNGLIDLVVSEDSDLMACGCSHVLYKMDDHLKGTLLRRNDMFESSTLRDFSEAMLAVVFAACGCDYCDKLLGIGFKTAVRIVTEAFFRKESSATPPTTPPPPLKRVLQDLFAKAWDQQTATPEFQIDFERKFLSAILMYRHPVVFDPIAGRTVVARSDGTPQRLDSELASYPPYVTLFQQYLHSVVGDLIPRPLCIYVAEGWISPRTQHPYPIPDTTQLLPATVRRFVENRQAAAATRSAAA